MLGDRTFSKNPDRTIKVTLAMPALLGITNGKGERTQVASKNVETNPDAWLADVARIKTGTPAACWLREVADKESRPGEHLITVGFPGLSFQTLTIYTGIMSARLTTNLPTVILDTGEAFLHQTSLSACKCPSRPDCRGHQLLTMRIEQSL